MIVTHNMNDDRRIAKYGDIFKDWTSEARLPSLTAMYKRLMDNGAVIFCIQEISRAVAPKLTAWFEEVDFMCYTGYYSSDNESYVLLTAVKKNDSPATTVNRRFYNMKVDKPTFTEEEYQNYKTMKAGPEKDKIKNYLMEQNYGREYDTACLFVRGVLGKYTIMNTHLGIQKQSRMMGMRLFTEWFNHASKYAPTYGCGDFNTFSEDFDEHLALAPHKSLSIETGSTFTYYPWDVPMTSSDWDTVLKMNKEETIEFLRAKGKDIGGCLDQIFGPTGIKVTSPDAYLLRDKKTFEHKYVRPHYPSDHLPLMANLV